MTKFYYSSQEDRNLIDNSFDYLAKLIFGSRHKEDIDTVEDKFLDKVEEVHIYPQGIVNKYVNYNVPGCCTYNENTKKWRIDMLGYGLAEDDQLKFIEHEGVHEFCHIFACLLPEITKTKSIVKKGILRENEGGMIAQKDPITKKYVHTHYYGKMINETMMDIISAMAINQFSPNKTNISVDDVFDKNYKDIGNVETGYTFFTSITRLIISAFANTPRDNFTYQQVSDLGESVFKLNVQMVDGSYKRANDFLYGIIFDPLHIENEFDKYVGEDSYRCLNIVLDAMFANREKYLTKDNIKLVMGLVANFANAKRAYCLSNGIMDENESNQLINQFNTIWNSLYKEYGISFTKQEIDNIYSQARGYMYKYDNENVSVK